MELGYRFVLGMHLHGCSCQTNMQAREARQAVELFVEQLGLTP